MKNIYYLIWVDSIVGFRKNNPTRDDWKFTVFVTNTTCNALNLFSIYALLKFFGIKTFIIKIDIIPLPIFNSFLGFVIQYASIFIILNYFLIFRKERYKVLIEKYPNKNGKIGMIYVMCSVLIGYIFMILYGILR